MYTNETIDKNACAYTEIYEILRIFPKELVAKIPREQIMFFTIIWIGNINVILQRKTLGKESC